jgi:hypothetical protein
MYEGSGYTLVLKEVTSDSRCPQGAQLYLEAQVIVLCNNKKISGRCSD